jgi:hypothetical protein
MSIIIQTLTGAQISMASHIAVMRRISNEQGKIAPKHGAPTGKGSWEMDIKGCGAELAVALYVNLVWCGTVGRFRQRDVGGLVEVRSTTETRYSLRIDPDDADDAPFVLVWPRDSIREYDLVGWCLGHEAKQQKWWDVKARKSEPAFWVPWNDPVLRDMATLLDWVREHRFQEEQRGVA